MTKKDFEAFATAFGVELKTNVRDDFGKTETFWNIMHVFETTAKQINHNFDGSRFEQWVIDIAENVRDINGKKIKK